MGNFWTFFAFPLNLLLLIIWIAGLWTLWKKCQHSAVTRFLLSAKATISSLVLLIGSCLWIALAGDRDFVQSVFFVLVLIYAESVVLMVVFRGWRRPGGAVRWRFLLIHLGLLIAVGAGLLGSADSYEMRVRLTAGETVREAYLEDGSRRVLPYELQLIDYHAKVAEDGLPSYYEAKIEIARADSREVRSDYTITVNHPCESRWGENIYLASVSEDYCVLQIVREPWRHLTLTGILMLLAGAFLLFIKGPVRKYAK